MNTTTKELMSFSKALELLKLGHKVARNGWNVKSMWVIYNPASMGKTLTMYNINVYKNHGVDESEILRHLELHTVNAKGRRLMCSGWLVSEFDLAAEDWVLVE